MNTDTFTLDELLAALEGAQPDAAAVDGIRLQAIRDATGWSEVRISRYLRRLIDAGRVECVRVPFRRVDGIMTQVSAYRVVRREVAE